MNSAVTHTVKNIFSASQLMGIDRVKLLPGKRFFCRLLEELVDLGVGQEAGDLILEILLCDLVMFLVV